LLTISLLFVKQPKAFKARQKKGGKKNRNFETVALQSLSHGFMFIDTVAYHDV
jgi:hypothetical protein